MQLTKEYLGRRRTLFIWRRSTRRRSTPTTYAKGPIDGRQGARRIAVSLPGNGDRRRLERRATTRNWTGSQFDQANWYAFGRLAWDYALTPQAIAEEWARMTFSNDPAFVKPVVDMMMLSREAVVDYRAIT